MFDKVCIVIIGIFGGLFCIIASIYNWNFFFNNHKARFFVNIIGLTGARVFYIILGLILMLLGFMVVFNIIH
jgi:small neutral amino acid transporter SnatA (MarC family)